MRAGAVSPVVMRRIPSPDMRSNGPAESPEHEYMSPQAHAIDQILSPAHERESFVHLRELPADGVVPVDLEHWTLDGNTRRVVTQKVLVRTCSGTNRPAHELSGTCAIGQRPDAEFVRCQRCGALCCPRHARIHQAPEGDIILCERHMRQAIDNFDTWQHGYPRAPYAVSIPRGTSTP